jgi:MoxR-like ATPase
MARTFQNQLLNFMESGRVKVDQQRKQYDFEIKGVKVFATCNEITRLSKPLQSRFRRLHLPPYTKEQFIDIAVKVYPKLKEEISRIIGDVISLGKLVRKGDGPEEIEALVKTLAKYTDLNCRLPIGAHSDKTVPIDAPSPCEETRKPLIRTIRDLSISVF